MNGVFRCLRGFEYKILQIKNNKAKGNNIQRVPSSLNRKVTEEQLQRKLKELKSLKKKLYEVRKLEALERDIRLKKQELKRIQNKKNKRKTKVKTPKSKKGLWYKLKDWSFLESRQVAGGLLGLGFIKEPYYKNTFISLEVAYRKFLFGNLSLNLFIGFGGGAIWAGKSESSTNSDYNCYSYCVDEPNPNPSVTGSISDYFLFLPIRYRRFEFTFEKGYQGVELDIISWTKQSSFPFRWMRSSSVKVEDIDYTGMGIRVFFGKGRWSIIYRERWFETEETWGLTGSISF